MGRRRSLSVDSQPEIKFVQTDWRSPCVVILSALGLFAATSSAPGDSRLPELEPVVAPGDVAINQAIDRGVGFLLRVQNENGSWGSATQTKGLNIYAPIPGAHRAFRAAVTANCLAALIESGAADSNSDATKAAKRAEDWLLRYLPKVRRATGDAIYNVWAHAYGIRTLALLLEREEKAARQGEIRVAIKEQYDLLTRYESVDGGWGYYDFRYQTAKPSSSSISFTSATTLLAFARARQAGVEPPEKIVSRAIASIQRQRKPDNSYAYGEYLKMRPMLGINLPAGSLGRSQACNLALRRWGDSTITLEVIDTWLDRLWARNGWLDIGRKRPVPHESWQQVAGYFFYYGHYYAALCIEELPVKDAKVHQDHLATILLKLQEKNGSWWDFPFYNYHQQYGTAYALMSLTRCRTEP